ncbi:type II secretion system protein [Pleurocapsa sp. PCC 7319]|uniref:type II secretion system protein n=1 Tax=Pleurocapsa sp. PCC 7319 TaxID=118161 RepID=UPI0003487A7E|nr:type II secretion system protein [Pleurocapsa sp. PCC 7319]
MLLYNVRKKINKGFTLVEMITTVIIVGVIASVAAPNLLGMLNQARVKDGLAQVEGAIKETQRQAIRRGKICKIKFVTETIDGKSRQTINVVESTDTGETVSAGYYNGCLLSKRILPVDVSVNTGGITKITFSGKGNTDSSSEGIIRISHPLTTTEKCVQIEGLLGNILTGDFDSGTSTCNAS